MGDVVDKATRSRMMSGIRGKNTRPELIVRSGLHQLGLRFRLHVARLPGTPDLVFPKHRAVLFVHGCFWHRHEGCRYATTPSTNHEFWKEKFDKNVRRDVLVVQQLLDEGWRVGTIWECALRSGSSSEALSAAAQWIVSAQGEFEFPKARAGKSRSMKSAEGQIFSN